jgi:ClpP class serine protease
MKKLTHIVEKVNFEPWLVTVSTYSSIHALLESKLTGSYKAEDLNFDLDSEGATAIPLDMDNAGIARIGISGVLGHRISSLEKMCGGADYLDIQERTEDALTKGAKGILYAFDSNGGMVRGCSELAGYIAKLPVPTQAFTDSKCNSAAYWLASACSGFTASESSTVGSIGVILPWVDKSKLFELAGVKVGAFTNAGADLKATGATPSLSEEQAAHLQESVNYIGDQFQGFVNEHRKVKPVVFRAGTYFGKPAQEVGLIDAVGSYQDAYNSLTQKVRDKNLVPEPVGKQSRIQGNKMTKEELKAQHPELFNELLQEQEAASQQLLQTAANTERSRLAALDELVFTPECKTIVDAAKADGKTTADMVAVKIAKLVASDRQDLKTKVGVLAGAKKGSEIAEVDPTTGEEQGTTPDLTNRLKAHFAKRFGSIQANGSRN